jgi:hypothetical protein
VWLKAVLLGMPVILVMVLKVYETVTFTYGLPAESVPVEELTVGLGLRSEASANAALEIPVVSVEWAVPALPYSAPLRAQLMIVW